MVGLLATIAVTVVVTRIARRALAEATEPIDDAGAPHDEAAAAAHAEEVR